MVKQIITDTFETLGKMAGQTAKQVAQEPAKMAETAGKQMAGSVPAPEEQAAGQTTSPVGQAMKKRATQMRLDYLQKELAVLGKKKAQEEQQGQVQVQPKQEAIKQLETQKKKKEIEPLAVAQARLKGGTGERRRIGPSG